MVDIREFTSSKWLNAQEPAFDNGPIIATVKIVDEQEMPARNGKGVEYKLCIHWKEDIKPYIANKTNLKIAGAKLGTDTDGWPGARIKMERQPTQRPDGSMTEGIRFVSIKPPSSSSPQAPGTPKPPKAPATAESDWGDAKPASPPSPQANGGPAVQASRSNDDLDDSIPF